MRWIAEARERLRGLLFAAREDADTGEEMRFHLEMEADRRVREEGLDPAEARRRAAVAFGGVEKYREAVRDARGLAWVRGMSLDFRLGFRMLVRYPGLTLVGGLAMAFAIALGAATFEFLSQMVHPKLPLPHGGRIVALRNWDAAAGRVEPRALHDLAAWRAGLTTVRDVGAFRALRRGLSVGDGTTAEIVTVAEISAAGFRVAGVPPLLGRALAEADEREGAPPVVVIGHDVWRARFGGDPGVVGRTVRLGGEPATVVGVMPEGFAFPAAQGFWVPLRLDPLQHARGAGPALTRVFGRLAPGATLEGARSELATLGRRAAADFPETHAHLRPQVLPYARSFLEMSPAESAELMSVNLLLVPLVVLVCANVALLLFARAATRESEIVVRSALGASRGRIVAQLFAEALVLGAVAAVAGLAAAALVLRWGMGALRALIEAEFPFWLHASLSPATVLYAAGLTVLAAVVAGVLPALKVTRGLAPRLKQASAGGGGLRFGGVWTAVIVCQVAVTVVVPAHAFFLRRESAQLRAFDPGFAAGEFVSARIEPEWATPGASGGPAAAADSSRAEDAARFAATLAELERRLSAQPEVAGVTFADHLPGMHHPRLRVKVEGAPAASPDSALRPCGDARASCARMASVAADYFDVLGAPLVSGRTFHSGDAASDARAVIVNRAFVDRVLRGRDPVGLRVRYVEAAAGEADAEPGPWHEIVGVAPNLGMAAGGAPEDGAGIYHPAQPGSTGEVHVAVRVRADAASFAPRLQSIVAEVDPTLRLHDLLPLDEVHRGTLRWLTFLFQVTLLTVSIAVLLSLAGIYAVMSFTVSRRTREIGIRVALGADARRVVTAIFRRPLAQVGLGVAAGGVVAAGYALGMSGGSISPAGALAVAAYAAVMLGVCLLACIVPTRRALRVEPTDALRADG